MSLLNSMPLWGCLVPGLYLFYTDVTLRKLYDLVTIPMIIGGVIYGWLTGSLIFALSGAALGFFASLATAWITDGGLGGGDIKVLTALGAWFGYWGVTAIIVMGVLVAVLWDGFRQLKYRRLKEVLHQRIIPKIRGAYFEYGLGIEGVMPRQETSVPRIDSIPFGAFFIMSAWALQLYTYLWGCSLLKLFL